MSNSLLNIGKSALNTSQSWINVTGNNIANVDTPGYSRQYIDQRDRYAITYRPGEMGMGSQAQQVLRYYDSFLDMSYIRQNSKSSRWNQQDQLMTSLESTFNESNRVGISTTMNEFFKAWKDLSLYPDSTAHRESLLAYADNLSDMFRNTSDEIKKLQAEMDVAIQADVQRVNELAKAIADINGQITANTVDGISNPNSLYDERDRLVRELSELVNVDVIDNGKGNYTVQLGTGQPLVNGTTSYELAVLDQLVEKRLQGNSTFTGNVKVEGNDGFEYVLEIVDPGTPGAEPPVPPKFRVSLDGGKNWLKGDDGKDLTFDVVKDQTINVKGLKITFDDDQGLVAGDKIDIVPKKGLYWIEPTRGPENITPQKFLDGTDNLDRLTGGKITSYFNIRDDNCTRYLDELNALAKSLIWEVNRQHSQGAGLAKFQFLQGTESIRDINAALGSEFSGAAFGDKLTKGSVTFHFYDKETGEYKDDFTFEFDPKEDSLQDVADKINEDKDGDGKPDSGLTATIQDGKLQITSTEPNVEFAMGQDSSGLMAALGLNTFFSGDNAENMAINDMLHTNTGWIASGQVNGDGEINKGDNITAKNIGELMDKDVEISTIWKTVDNQSLSEFYANLVSAVGSDRRTSKTNANYHSTLTADLADRSNSVRGVNIDEEMTNLIRYQHSYTAAAKLITTADQMLQTLLGLKQ